MSIASRQRERDRGRTFVKGKIGSRRIRILTGPPGAIIKSSYGRYEVQSNGSFIRI